MTTARQERRGLGRGLSALMADINAEAEEASGTGRREVLPIESLVPNPDQPRRSYAPEALDELAASLRLRGILQPLIVRPHPGDSGLYEIVAGERRWRAAQIAQLHEVPVIIRDFSDTEVLEVALVENIQRADLNAIEEAAAIRQLMDRFGHTQEALSDILHKSRSHVANMLRLLTLPPKVQDWLGEGKLSAGHARALVSTKDPEKLARRVIDRGLSVRETEALARVEGSQATTLRSRRRTEKDADTRALEADLTAHLKLPVAITHSGVDGGRLTVTYRDLEQLDRLCQILAGSA